MARFFKIGLIVTGKGEARFLPGLLRSLTTTGNCDFRVLEKIDQLSPRTAPRHKLRMVGRGGLVSSRDFERIGAPARRHVTSDEAALVIVVDDLERARRDQHRDVFERYRVALDIGLGPHYTRGAVHFLANMLEAYYFADARALREVLGLTIADHEGDVEAIGHPKNELKALAPGFDEVRDGAKIVALLRLEHVLGDFSTCASLRSLFAWCVRKTGQPAGDRFCLSTGVLDLVTGPQLGHELRSLA